MEELRHQSQQVLTGDLQRVETMLVAQAHTLDTIFNRLASQAGLYVGAHVDVVDKYLRLALKAQSQSRTTLETLANIKNPPIVYAKQANISHGHQQVNNGMPAGHPAQAGNTESRPNELLEIPHGERMDAGTQGPARRGNPQVEAVVPIDRPQDRRRKG